MTGWASSRQLDCMHPRWTKTYTGTLPLSFNENKNINTSSEHKHKHCHSVYTSNSHEIISQSCCTSENQTNTLSKAKNKNLKAWSGVRFGFQDSTVISRVTEHSYSRWSCNVRTLKTVADNNKQKLGLIVFIECLYLVFAVISKIHYPL